MSRTMTFSVLLCLPPLLFGPPLSAQGAWSKVPPLPKACYSGQDTFSDDAGKARTELEAEIEKQEQINKGIRDQVFQMDQATLQQRMMAAVQKDPARSQEIMQAMQSMGSPQGQSAGTGTAPEGNDFHARKAKLMEEYQAESNKVLGPSHARALEANSEGPRVAAWAEYNRQYETVVCPRWFRTQASELMASYRTYLVEQRIPPLAEAERTSMRMPELLGVSTREFRPVAELKAVVDYLRSASAVFGQREREPRGTP